MLDSIRKLFDYHRFVAIAGVGCLIAGCALFRPTVKSPLDGKTLLNAEELNAEEQATAIKFAAAKKTLEQKQATMEVFAQIAGGLVTAYVPPPFTGIAVTGLGLLFAGATADGIRKNSVLNDYKNKLAVAHASLGVGADPNVAAS